MNGKISPSKLSKIIGMSQQATYHRIKTLEKLYEIHYFPEIDTEKLGYISYFVFIKFNDDNVPKFEDIRKAVESAPEIQLAMLTSGEYDLILYILSKNQRDFAYMIYNLRGTEFKAYPSMWYITPTYSSSRTLPLRDTFFELIKEKVWTRTKEKSNPSKKEISMIEYTLLKELNLNGSMSFTEIDRKFGYSLGASRYAYLKLKEKGILKRITLSMKKLPIKYNVLLFIDFFDINQFRQTRSNLLFEAITNSYVTNKYSLLNEMGIPEGFLMCMPIFSDNDLIYTEKNIQEKLKGIRLRKLIITNIVVGSFCYRRYDNNYTNQHKLLVEEYKLIKEVEKINYE